MTKFICPNYKIYFFQIVKRIFQIVNIFVKVYNVFVQITKCICPKFKMYLSKLTKKYLSEKESKYFGGLYCRCVQLTCKVWTPSTSLDGDARYKTLKLFPWKPFRQYFGGNLITYWFNLIFVWNGICTAFNRGGAIGSEFNWGRPGTSPVKILSINIAINLDHRFIKYPSTNQPINIHQYCPLWNRIEVFRKNISHQYRPSALSNPKWQQLE